MEMKDLIRQVLREQTFDYTPEIGRVDVSGDFSGKITNLISALGISGGLKEKLDFLKNITEDGITNIKNPQKQLSAIILLQYLKFIRINNNPQVAGFAFENYLAGLLGGRVITGDKAVDVEDANGIGYQVKFYMSTNTSAITVKESHDDADEVNQFVLAVKDVSGSDVEIYIMGRKAFDDLSLIEVKIRYKNGEEQIVKKPKINLPEEIKDALENKNNGGDFEIIDVKNKGLSTTRFKSNSDKHLLPLDGIEGATKSLGDGILTKIKELYDELGQLENFVDAISVGVDREGSPQDIIKMATSAEAQSEVVGTKADEFKKEVISNQ
jgi:hypothetical protein